MLLQQYTHNLNMSTDSTEYQPCACCNRHRTFGWQKSGFIMVILLAAVTSAMFVPYIAVVAAHTMPAFIPFISQTGGKPPQTGILGIFLLIAGFTGFIAFVLYFESVKHRNRLNSRLLRRLNYACLPTAITACIGFAVVAAFPVGYTGAPNVPNFFEWIVTVLLEHSLGAVFVFFGIVIYQFLLTGIWWLLPDVSRRAKFIKLAFCVGHIINFLIVVKPMPTYILEELGPDHFNIEKLRSRSYELPVVFTTSYLICAFCEWVLAILSLLNLLTLYKDFQRISFHVTLRPKFCLSNVAEQTPVFSLKILP